MEFLNIGLGELILIMVLALVVLGPERLPEVMRQIGRFTALVRGVSDEFQRQLLEETREIREPFQETRREIEASIRPVQEAQADLNRSASEIRAATKLPTLTTPPNQVARGSAPAGEEPVPNGQHAEASYKPVSRPADDEEASDERDA